MHANTEICPLPCLEYEADESWISPLPLTLSTSFNISYLYFTLQVNLQTETIQDASPPHPTIYSTRNSSSLYSSLIYSILRVIQNRTDVYPTVASTGLFLIFPYFLQSHYPSQPLEAPGAFTQGCRHRSAGSRGHPGPPLGHSPSRMVGAADCHRTSRHWNVAGLISDHWWIQVR